MINTKRVTLASLVLRWVSLGVNLVWVLVAKGPHTIRWLALVGLAAGAAVALVENLLPLIVEKTTALMRRTPMAFTMAVYDTMWMFVVVYATGGVEHGFWTRYVSFLVARAILLPPRYSWAYLFVCEASFVGATALAGTLTRDTMGLVAQGAFAMILVNFYALVTLSGQRALSRVNAATVRLLSEQNTYVAEAFEKLGAGDLSESVKLQVAEAKDVPLRRLLDQIAESFSDYVTRMREVVRQVKLGSSELAGASQQLLAQAEQESTIAAQQSGAVTETSTTIEELAQTAAQIAESAEAVARLAEDTSQRALEGQTAVADTANRMERISERASGLRERTLQMGELSQEIGAILSLIDEISDQTNLLALNAAIEAARAGEYGRGFSVVADEVRKLAERSQAATKDVQGLVAEIRTQAHQMISSTEEQSAETGLGQQAAASATVALSGIADMAERTTGAAKEISIATAQQRSASDQVVTAMASVSDSSQQFASGSQQATNAAAELSRLARDLTDTMSHFRVE